MAVICLTPSRISHFWYEYIKYHGIMGCRFFDHQEKLNLSPIESKYGYGPVTQRQFI